MKLRMMLGFVTFLLMACGIKGPPLPPLSEETIQKQKNETTASSVDATKATQKKK